MHILPGNIRLPEVVRTVVAKLRQQGCRPFIVPAMGSHGGATPEGQTAVLAERGIPVVGFEKGSDIGGNWRYRNDNGQSAAYRSLHINTSPSCSGSSRSTAGRPIRRRSR